MTRGELAAGGLAEWLVAVRAAIDGTRDAEVPCDGCTACCRSSQFVHIGPDETDTLAHIPPTLVFPAPLLPPGHVLLGYDAQGRCPLLVDDRCSIYAHRPRTCRTYDCRVFAATGVVPDDKPLVAERAERWRFTLATAVDRLGHDAAHVAAARVAEVEPAAPPTARAVLALELAELFVRDGRVVDPGPDAVRVELQRRRAQP